MSADSTRITILKVANRLFSRYGFHKTSMDEIAKTARKAKGSLYYHFESKEVLFKEVIAGEFEHLKQQLEIVIQDKNLSAFEKIKSYLLRRMEVMKTATNYHETLQADFFEKFHFIDELRSDLDRWEKEKLHGILIEGMEAGQFKHYKNVDILLDILLMVFKGLEIPFFLQNKFDTYAPHFDGFIDILNKGIST